MSIRLIAMTLPSMAAAATGPSRDCFFRPLNEHVRVFDRLFQIVQDVMIDASREAEAMLKDRTSLTIQATLDCQACDDAVCFNPRSAPMSWTVGLKPLDRERPR